MINEVASAGKSRNHAAGEKSFSTVRQLTTNFALSTWQINLLVVTIISVHFVTVRK